MIPQEQRIAIRECLHRHEPFVLPTETVYGLAVDATDEIAVRRVYEIKNRPRDNPMNCHCHSIEQIEQYIDLDQTPAYWRKLAQHLSPGPITYFLPVKRNTPIFPAIAGMKKVGCRIPKHPVALDIIRFVDIPLAAPSANTSGRYSATNLEMVQADLQDKVQLYIDGGESVIGIESTTIDCIDEHEIVIYRPGYIGKETIELTLEAIGITDVTVRLYEGIAPDVVTPGMKYKHYQPLTDMVCVDGDCLHYIKAQKAIHSHHSFSIQLNRALNEQVITRDCLNFMRAGEAIHSHPTDDTYISEDQLCLFALSDADFSFIKSSVTLPLNLQIIASQLYGSLFKLDRMHKKLILFYIDPQFQSLSKDPLYSGVMNRLEKICGMNLFSIKK